MLILRLLRMFSIDIVAGVIAGSFFAAGMLDVQMPFSYFLIIGLTTWIIYLGDHVLDGFTTGKDSQNPTHHFFYRAGYILLGLILIILLVDSYVLFMLRNKGILKFGLILSLGVLLYFLQLFFFRRSVFFLKELWIALIYTAAIWGGPVLYAEKALSQLPFMAISAYFLLVLSNVLSFSFFEYDTDVSENNGSFAINFGRKNCRLLIFCLLIISAAICVAGFFMAKEFLLFYLILSLMAILLFAMIFFYRFFENNRRYGWFADSTFILPFLSLLKY